MYIFFLRFLTSPQTTKNVKKPSIYAVLRTGLVMYEFCPEVERSKNIQLRERIFDFKNPGN